MVVYGLGEEDKELLYRKLTEISLEAETPFRIVLDTNQIDPAIRAIQTEKGIMAVLLGVDSLREDKQKLSLKLGRFALQHNRDHYVVYLIKNRQELEVVLPLCARSSGVLICPLAEKPIVQVFKPVFEDYRTIYENDTSQDDQWINLKSAGKVYRIRTSEIILVQSVDKMIEFHTKTQDLSVYSNMENVKNMLPASFLRCHRSYIINCNQIQYIDFREMTIHMMDGSSAPLARSFKDAVNQVFAEDSL